MVALLKALGVFYLLAIAVAAITWVFYRKKLVSPAPSEKPTVCVLCPIRTDPQADPSYCFSCTKIVRR